MIEEDMSIARPYAEAVYMLAKETDALTDWSEGLQVLSQIVSESSIKAILIDPSIENTQQLALITDIAGEALTEPLHRFLKILAKNERLLQLPTISSLFRKLQQAASGNMEVEVISAYILKDPERKKLESALSKKFARSVNIVSTKDHSLIGGIKIKADDFVIDGSIKGQLIQLANQLGI